MRPATHDSHSTMCDRTRDRALRRLIPLAVLLAALVAPAARAQFGACCFDNGACIELEALECIQFGGDYQGNGTTCAGVTCVASGACCIPIDGSCSVITAAQCNSAGGNYQGDNTNCNACPDCPGVGLCYVAHNTPGCNNSACCSTVCDADPFCCTNQWDVLCVDEAFDLCGNCGDPGAGDCYVNNGSPGCDDGLCCETICAIDAFCCNTFWDGACADQATALCTDCGDPGTGSCLVANGSPYCDDADCCETVCASDSSCCDTQWDLTCADLAAVLCNPCPWDCGDGDGVVGIVDLLALLAQWGGPGGSCDMQFDGTVDTVDLLDLLSSWGPCP